MFPDRICNLNYFDFHNKDVHTGDVCEIMLDLQIVGELQIDGTELTTERLFNDEFASFQRTSDALYCILDSPTEYMQVLLKLDIKRRTWVHLPNNFQEKCYYFFHCGPTLLWTCEDDAHVNDDYKPPSKYVYLDEKDILKDLNVKVHPSINSLAYCISVPYHIFM